MPNSSSIVSMYFVSSTGSEFPIFKMRYGAELEELEIEVGVKTQRSPDLGFCYMIYRWANGSSLNQVLKGSDMSVGDFVRSTKQLVDLLGQIGNAAPELNKKCREAVKLIDRGVVTYLLGDL